MIDLGPVDWKWPGSRPGAAAEKGGEPDPGAEYALEMTHIDKAYGGVPVLHDVSVRVRRGSIHAIVGHNGAGKSTLMRIALGAEKPNAGEVRVAGRRLAYTRPAEARGLGLGMVMQERSLIRTLSGLDNLFLNAETCRAAGVVDLNRERAEVESLLDELGVPKSLLTTKAGDMSTIEQELIEIARALRLGSQVLVLDEPTAPLGREEISRLFQVLRTIAARGTGIVLITHHLAEVFAVCDEVTCLREGRVALSCPTSATDVDRLIAAMLGRSDGHALPVQNSPATRGRVDCTTRRPALSLRDLAAGSKLAGVSFEAYPGEILGIIGLAGSGRTTLLRILFGDLPAGAGEMWLDGEPYRPRGPHEAMARGVFLIPEDRGVHGLMLNKPIAENLMLVTLERLRGRFGMLRFEDAHAQARDMLRRLDIRATGIEQAAGELSGGNQQKVVLAKALMLDAKILLLDEPTFGVDIGASREIIANVREATDRGSTVLWVSSDLLEVIQVADRILVLRDGGVGAVLGPSEADKFTENALVAMMQRVQFHGGPDAPGVMHATG